MALGKPVLRGDLDGAEVHGLRDDAVVVVEAKGVHVHGRVEGPGVGGVAAGHQLLQQLAAAPQRRRQPGPPPPRRPVRDLPAGRPDGPLGPAPAPRRSSAAAARGRRRGRRGRRPPTRRRVAGGDGQARRGDGQARGGDGGGVGFPLDALPVLEGFTLEGGLRGSASALCKLVLDEQAS